MKSYCQALLTASICLNMLNTLMHICIHYSLLLPQLPLLGIINGYSNSVTTKLLSDTFHVYNVCFCKCSNFVLRYLIVFFFKATSIATFDTSLFININHTINFLNEIIFSWCLLP